MSTGATGPAGVTEEHLLGQKTAGFRGTLHRLKESVPEGWSGRYAAGVSASMNAGLLVTVTGHMSMTRIVVNSIRVDGAVVLRTPRVASPRASRLAGGCLRPRRSPTCSPERLAPSAGGVDQGSDLYLSG